MSDKLYGVELRDLVREKINVVKQKKKHMKVEVVF